MASIWPIQKLAKFYENRWKSFSLGQTLRCPKAGLPKRWGQAQARRQFTGVGHPYWVSPSGYGSPERRLLYTKLANGLIPRINAASFEEQLASHEIVAGTPDQCIAQLKILMEATRPGIMGFWANDGTVSAEDTRNCIRLLCGEVMPALRNV